MAEVTIDPRGVTGYVPAVTPDRETRELFLPSPATRPGPGDLIATAPARHRAGPGRGIGLALAATAVAIALTAAALGAVASGLLRVRPPSAPAVASQGATVATRLSAGAASSTYRMVAPSYGVLLHAAGPCWVQVTGDSGQTLFAGVLPAGASKLLAGNGTTVVRLGASAIQVVVSAGSHRQSLFTSLPQAPFTLTLNG